MHKWYTFRDVARVPLCGLSASLKTKQTKKNVDQQKHCIFPLLLARLRGYAARFKYYK